METLQAYGTEQLEERVKELEFKSYELQQSIEYASSLQKSMLPHVDRFKNSFTDAFTYYQPRDIVGGDFYWIYPHGDRVYFAVGDCTGHGVPGAMVSMAAMTLLRNIIRIDGLRDPAAILSMLDVEITTLFNEHMEEGYTRDGVDMAFCCFDLKRFQGYFAGAGRSLLLIRNNQLEEFSGTPFHIGYMEGFEKGFQTTAFRLEAGDQFYLFSDGYTDQFGGEKVKKFNRKRFRNLLLSVADMSMEQQRKELEFSFRNWKGGQEQIDDVCIVGVKV